MTGDGITDEDWDRVYQASLDVANASAYEDQILIDHSCEALFDILDELEKRYGRLPSLLATRADFSDDPKEAIILLEEALAKSKDFVSLALALHSLVDLMIFQNEAMEKIEPKLSQLEELAEIAPDLFSAGSVVEMRAKVARMR